MRWLGLLAVLIPSLMYGCSCMRPGPACEAAWKADALFVGSVSRVNVNGSESGDGENGFLRARVSLDVDESFIGVDGATKQVEVLTGLGGGDCGYPFRRGERYLVYAYKTKGGSLATGICNATKAAEKAMGDLAYLRSLHKTPAAPAFVSGYVMNGEAPYGRFPSFGVPPTSGLPGVKVTLSDGKRTRREETGDDGGFRFEGLTPAKYRLTIAKAGYDERAFDEEELAVHEMGCAFTIRMMVVDRRILGRLLRNDNTAAAGIRLQLIPANAVRNMSPSGLEATTNGDGSYQFKNVPAGSYRLGVNLDKLPSVELPYAPTFYPGVDNIDRATVIDVAKGPGSQEHYDFALPPAQHGRTIDGFVV